MAIVTGSEVLSLELGDLRAEWPLGGAGAHETSVGVMRRLSIACCGWEEWCAQLFKFQTGRANVTDF